MADKTALRDLQTRLAERLLEARTQERTVSWLAVEAGGHGVLFPLPEAGEIFAVGALLEVPHTHPWFLGVANLRGGLHGVVDLAAFLSGTPMRRVPHGEGDTSRDQARLVALNPALECNAALLVDKLLGLRNATQLKADDTAAGARPAFAGLRYRDEAGRLWQEVRLAALADDPAFLAIVG